MKQEEAKYVKKSKLNVRISKTKKMINFTDIVRKIRKEYNPNQQQIPDLCRIHNKY